MTEEKPKLVLDITAAPQEILLGLLMYVVGSQPDQRYDMKFDKVKELMDGVGNGPGSLTFTFEEYENGDAVLVIRDAEELPQEVQEKIAEALEEPK